MCRGALWHADCRRNLLIDEGSASRLQPDSTLTLFVCPHRCRRLVQTRGAPAMEGVYAAVFTAFSVAYSGYYFTHLARK